MAATDSRKAQAGSLSGGRLAFERAIRRSTLPAPARHVALTIATWADVGSGVIPERFQPSISVLAEATGMGATTVKKHLSVLEAGGWLLRDRPEIARARTEHARTQYALMVPTSARGHGPEPTMPRSGGDHAMGESGPSHGPETTRAWSAAGHKSSLNPDESPGSTSSSPAGPVGTEPAAEPEATDDGGGGGDLSPSRPLAEEIAADLCAGQPVHRPLRETLTSRLAAALDAGWTVDGLAVYLHLADGFEGSRAAVCSWRLDPARIPAPEPLPAVVAAAAGVHGPLPSAADYGAATLGSVLYGEAPALAPSETWPEAVQRAQARLGGGGSRGGGGGHVDDWMQLAGKGHQPYSNDPWHAPADPVEAAKIPWCGHQDCDEKTRLRPGATPQDKPDPCQLCHPMVRF